ncbi:MAG: WYL domain-containing protein [Candidatus Omnitrophota bacterium]|jgi:DNA polymerase III epsilon subunit family exonuclease|nr:MAG: WYL domain-containing protein [Candidatus Omnitrophota bacterium]
MDINDIEFTIFDTETTGLNPHSGDRVVEIAAVRIKGFRKISTFESLINPGRGVSEAAFNVNHIAESMLQTAPFPEKVFPEFLSFIKNSCICSYNASFDIAFLDKELGLLGQRLDDNVIVIDMLKMARRLLPGLERYALWFVADYFGIKRKQEHRALADVEFSLEVFYRLMNMLKERSIVEMDNFMHLFGIRSEAVSGINNEKIAEIQEAIDLGVEIKIRYISAVNAKVTERNVLPKQIIQDKGQDYLVGYCSLRQDQRTFRIDGILDIEIL